MSQEVGRPFSEVNTSQLANTKFGTVYVETETALEKENGMDDLKAVAKAANISDEADLKPMILKDIADKTGLDISTISRVSNVKYAQTRWGTFPLRYFFSDGYKTGDGEELSTRKIKLALKDIISKEDKAKPLSDDALAVAMKKAGFPIARRTIAKFSSCSVY